MTAEDSQVQPTNNRIQLRHFAEDLHKLVTQIELHDFALVGFSMGGGEVARYLGNTERRA